MDISKLAEKLERDKDSHKGENGKLLIIGGSREYTGAPALAARAAYRSGCDLVRIDTSSKVRDVIASYSENFIVGSYGERFNLDSLDKVKEHAEWCDAAVIGPGIGEKDHRAVTGFAENFGKPMVADASAVKPAARAEKSKTIFTPHSGEMKELKEVKGVEELTKVGSVVLEKGVTDRIHLDDKIIENSTGNASMTVGGTGDSLAGLAGSLLSQDLDVGEAAYLAAYVNGRAGEKAAEELGPGMTAADMVEKIPEVIQDL